MVLGAVTARFLRVGKTPMVFAELSMDWNSSGLLENNDFQHLWRNLSGQEWRLVFCTFLMEIHPHDKACPMREDLDTEEEYTTNEIGVTKSSRKDLLM